MQLQHLCTLDPPNLVRSAFALDQRLQQRLPRTPWPLRTSAVRKIYRNVIIRMKSLQCNFLFVGRNEDPHSGVIIFQAFLMITYSLPNYSKHESFVIAQIAMQWSARSELPAPIITLNERQIWNTRSVDALSLQPSLLLRDILVIRKITGNAERPNFNPCNNCSLQLCPVLHCRHTSFCLALGQW